MEWGLVFEVIRAWGRKIVKAPAWFLGLFGLEVRRKSVELAPQIRSVEAHGGQEARLVIYNGGADGSFRAECRIMSASDPHPALPTIPFYAAWLPNRETGDIIGHDDYGTVVLGTVAATYLDRNTYGTLGLIEGYDGSRYVARPPFFYSIPWENWGYEGAWIIVSVRVKTDPPAASWVGVFKIHARRDSYGVIVERTTYDT
jgi:hypothetical protein